MPSHSHPLPHFLISIKSEALEQHDGEVRIGGKIISSKRFADDINALTLKISTKPAQDIKWR